jgi:hypothetical protein
LGGDWLDLNEMRRGRRLLLRRVPLTLYNEAKHLLPLTETQLNELRSCSSLRKLQFRYPETIAFVSTRVLHRDIVRYMAEAYMMQYACVLCGKVLDDEHKEKLHRKVHWIRVMIDYATPNIEEDYDVVCFQLVLWNGEYDPVAVHAFEEAFLNAG